MDVYILTLTSLPILDNTDQNSKVGTNFQYKSESNEKAKGQINKR